MILKILLVFFTFSSIGLAFDHNYQDYNLLLKKHVSFKKHQSLVDYKNIKTNTEALDKILKTLSEVSEKEYQTWDEKQKLSFLINSYNAFTIKLIIDHYPMNSIKDIGSFFSSPWKIEFFTLLGKKRHLDYIEHERIRKEFDEPRIHFAVVCASISCPTLQNQAFTANNLESLLDLAAKNFLNDPNKNRFDKKSNKLYLSKIFDWYGDDFKKSYGGHLAYIQKFYPFAQKPRIEFLDYDWSLNELK